MDNLKIYCETNKIDLYNLLVDNKLHEKLNDDECGLLKQKIA